MLLFCIPSYRFIPTYYVIGHYSCCLMYIINKINHKLASRKLFTDLLTNFRIRWLVASIVLAVNGKATVRIVPCTRHRTTQRRTEQHGARHRTSALPLGRARKLEAMCWWKHLSREMKWTADYGCSFEGEIFCCYWRRFNLLYGCALTLWIFAVM